VYRLLLDSFCAAVVRSLPPPRVFTRPVASRRQPQFLCPRCSVPSPIHSPTRFLTWTVSFAFDFGGYLCDFFAEVWSAVAIVDAFSPLRFLQDCSTLLLFFHLFHHQPFPSIGAFKFYCTLLRRVLARLPPFTRSFWALLSLPEHILTSSASLCAEAASVALTVVSPPGGRLEREELFPAVVQAFGPPSPHALTSPGSRGILGQSWYLSLLGEVEVVVHRRQHYNSFISLGR